MHSNIQFISSARLLILFFLSLSTVRSLGVTSDFPTFPSESLSPSGPATDLESGSITILEDFMPGLGGGSALDAILVPGERRDIEEVLDGAELFIFSLGSEVNARQWLAYLAPETFAFDVAVQNSSAFLQSLVDSSTVPFEGTISPEIATELATNNVPPAQFPFQIFLGIDLQDSNSAELEVDFTTQNDIPIFQPIDFLIQDAVNVPEPSAFTLIFLALTGSLSRRKRA